MNENIFNPVEESNIETNAFSRTENSEYDRPPGNCPPGHFKAIQSGGEGHWVGDSCGCEPPNGPSVTIGFLAYPLIFAAIFLIIVFKK